jgi:hypothetical protein
MPPVADTMIAVSKETRKSLQSLRITRRESYDEIINRLIKKTEEPRSPPGSNETGEYPSKETV